MVPQVIRRTGGDEYEVSQLEGGTFGVDEGWFTLVFRVVFMEHVVYGAVGFIEAFFDTFYAFLEGFVVFTGLWGEV
jgi:hypothetical protein